MSVTIEYFTEDSLWFDLHCVGPSCHAVPCCLASSTRSASHPPTHARTHARTSTLSFTYFYTSNPGSMANNVAAGVGKAANYQNTDAYNAAVASGNTNMMAAIITALVCFVFDFAGQFLGTSLFSKRIR